MKGGIAEKTVNPGMTGVPKFRKRKKGTER